MSWKLIKLGSLLTQSKVPSEAPDANRRIRVKLNVGGVEKRPVSNEVEGATNYYTRKAGQFIFGTQNFHKGAFGVVPLELDGFETSNDIPSFDVSKDCLPEWIFFCFKVGDRYKELEKLARGVGSKRVHPKQIFELVIPVPPVAKQLEIIEQVQASAARQRMIVEESDQQLTHLTHLRQALLREAMQGQLLPQDPTDESASFLLKKLQMVKSDLIKGKFLKSEKPLPGISDEEIPYVVPENWTWCRLADLCSHISDIDHSMPRAVLIGGVKFLSAKDLLDNGTINYDRDIKYISEEDFAKLSRKIVPQKGDIIYSRIGAKLGKARVVNRDERFLVSYSCCTIRALIPNIDFLVTLLDSGFVLKQALGNTTMHSIPDLGMQKIKEFLIPLPPLAEQHRIVAKLEQLMQHCDALEQRIRESRRLAEQLLQTALREALAPPVGTEPAEDAELETAEAEAAPASKTKRGRPHKEATHRNNQMSMEDLFN